MSSLKITHGYEEIRHGLELIIELLDPILNYITHINRKFHTDKDFESTQTVAEEIRKIKHQLERLVRKILVKEGGG